MLLDGLGLNAFIGATHFDLKSWDKTLNHSSHKPALNLGATLEYQKTVYKKLAVTSVLTYNHVVMSSPQTYLYLYE